MSIAPKFDDHVWTVAEYLAFERASDQKHDYIDGKIVAMSGASRSHNLITANTSAKLHAQLEKRPCELYTNDMKVRITSKHYAYPDIVIVCGQPQFEDDQEDILLNPTVIIEVLSSSTENYDRGLKGYLYREQASLQEYLMISQEKPNIEHYTRIADTDNEWRIRVINQLDSVIELQSIGCTLNLNDLYAKVEF